MKKRNFSRAVSLLLSLVLLCTMLPVVPHAGTPDRFVLTAEVGGKLLIAPEYVSCKPGQTVREALAESSHSFTGLEKDWITAIDGVPSDSLTRGDQNGNHDLNAPAANVTHYRFSESGEAQPSEGLLTLMTVMADYLEEPADVQKAAEASYDRALKGFVGASSKDAADLAAAITDEITAYKGSLEGEAFPVTFEGFTASAYPGIEIIAVNAYGKVFTDDGDGLLQLPAGTYTYRISRSGDHISGSVEVSGACTVTGSFPSQRWMGEMAFSDTYDADFEAGAFHQEPWEGRELTVSVSDSFTGTIYTCAAYQNISGQVPTLEAIYTNTAGEQVSTELAFQSKNVGPTQVLAVGAQGNTVIYRISVTDSEGRTMSQDYPVHFVRTPSLKSITVTDQDGKAQAATAWFDPAVNAYTYKVVETVTAVTVTAEPTDSGYQVQVNGQDAASGVTVPLNTDEAGKPVETTVTVTVSGSGVTGTYTLKIVPGAGKTITFKTTAANVELRVVNRDGLELPFTRHVDTKNYNRYLYTLVPGEEYHYVAVRDGCYFAEDTFILGLDSTITVDVPGENWLGRFDLRTSSGSSGPVLPVEPAFDPACHSYTVTIPDYNSYICAWAEAIPQDVTIQAVYEQIDKSGAYHGTEVSVDLPSGSSKSTTLSRLLINQNACGNTLRVRLTQNTDGSGITFYQEYTFRIQRRLALHGLSVEDRGAVLPLTQEETGKLKFKNDILRYTITVPMALQTLDVLPVTYTANQNNLHFGQTETGYHVSVNGVDADAGRASAKLSGTMQADTVTVTVTNDLAPDASTDYVITVKKAAPTTVNFTVDPADALIFVSDHATHGRLWPENSVLQLSEGFLYDYTVTAPGYVGHTGTMTVTRDGNQKLIFKMDDQTLPVTVGPDGITGSVDVSVTLSKSPANSAIDPNIPAQWPNFRGNSNHNAVTDAPIPYRANDATLYWAVKLGKGWGGNAAGCPIVVDGDLITYAATTLYRVDAMTGKVLATGSMVAPSSFSIIPPVYAEGMIFMQLGNGIVQAFDAKTLQSLWVYHDPLRGQCNTPITVHNGYLYTGFWKNETSPANFVCLSIHDEDPTNPKEEKSSTWRLAQNGGFYWAGAYVCDDYLLVGTDDGHQGYETNSSRLLLLNPTTGAILDSWEGLLGDIRCNISRDPDTGKFCFTSKGGRFYGVQVVPDGNSWKLDDKWELQLANGDGGIPMSTSTPAIHNGRAYIGVSGAAQFGSDGHNITVIDLNRRAIAYSVATAGYPQTSGLITTAYEKETGYVYVYFIDNQTPGALRVLRDRPGQTAPNYTVQEGERELAYPIFTPTGQLAQYAICSPLVDDYGTLYFKNDSGMLMAVGSTITSLDVTVAPAKTQYLEGETFDPAGMTVTATYANGKTRDVTEYVTWNTEALSAGTNRITLEFPYVVSQNRENGNSMDTGVVTPKPHVDLPITVLTPGKLGDTNNDGKITSADAVLVLQAEAQLLKLDLTAADVSGDGIIDSTDAALILQFVSGQITAFPAEKK